MKVKKGDTVLVIAGKDKGAKGKVIQAYPTRDRVLVEGVNRIKKHTRVSQNQRGAQSGGIVTQEAPIHVSNVMVVDSDGKPTRVGKKTDGRRQAGPDLPAQREGDLMMTTAEKRAAPRLKQRYRDEIRGGAAGAVRLRQRHADPGRRQGRRQHGCRRRRPRREADRRRGSRPGHDHRPEAAGPPGDQVHRAVQAARGHADRREGHAARRPDVGVPGPAADDRAAPYP